ncbi:MAG: prepilin-type N-terminal cleavage/methylation domain-containing protein [Campylobacterota bacterium]|nr:prepilin-type N-terminal cleavage/methylation domain-containing protein [Campylobacterota bacterium]
MPTVSNSRAFTLFELLIVVLLIGILYGVFVHKLTKPPLANTDKLTLKNIKTFLADLPYKRKAEIICLEPCKECHVYLDGKKADEKGFSLFTSSPNIYFPDTFGQIRTITFLPLIDKNHAINNVCFKFSLFNNKSSSHYAVENDEKYYLFDPYMKPVAVSKSFSDVTAFFDNSELLPSDTRDYDH